MNKLWRGNRSGKRWLDPAAVGFKQTAALTIRAMGIKPLNGPVELDIVFFTERDRDIDGGLKVLLDALQGAAYHNDSQVKRLSVELFKAGRAGPRTMLSFGPLETDGTYRAEVERLLRRA